jgi:tRNA G18 (ribose-2'-O)-methylase SpoU
MPMLGRSDSLNLAVATGISLYEYVRHAYPEHK